MILKLTNYLILCDNVTKGFEDMIFDKILKIFTDEYDDDEIIDKREKKTKEIVKPKDSAVVKTSQMKTISSESLDENSNLRRAKPFTKLTTSREDEEVVKQHTFGASSSFKRIDFDPVVNIEEQPKKEEVPNLEAAPLTMKFNAEALKQKPFISANENNQKKPSINYQTKSTSAANSANPNYYKPSAVISPIYGCKDLNVANNDNVSKAPKKVFKSEIEKDDPVLSPMYGVVTEQMKAVNPDKKPAPVRQRKQASGNMTLEEMLSMDAHDQNLEFTLFDVKVDQNEFVSRENKVIKED